MPSPRSNWSHAPPVDWYKSRLWRNRRGAHLREFPLCAMCEARGLVVMATVADHVTPHGGDWNAFRLGKLQSLCASCHSGDKRSIELGRPRLTYGADGWPVQQGASGEDGSP